MAKQDVPEIRLPTEKTITLIDFGNAGVCSSLATSRERLQQ